MATHPTPPRGAGGFTLLECLVATGLGVVIAATATLSYPTLASNWRLNTAARQVVLDLRLARSRAILDSVNHRLRFPPSAAAYQRQKEAAPQQYEDAAPPTALPPGIRIARCTGAGSSITFRPRGHAITFGTITLINRQGQQREVVVDIAGRARIK